MDKLRLRFEKTGRAVYISHLDLMRVLQRGFTRAGLKLKYSEGFNPHAVLSVCLPLSVGMGSVCELMDFRLAEDTDLAALPEKLNAALPEGIRAMEVYPQQRKIAELKWLCVDGRFDYDHRDTEELAPRLMDFFSAETRMVSRRTKRGEAPFDLAPHILSLSVWPGEGSVAVQAVLSAQEPTVNPELLVAALRFDAPELAPDFAFFTRVETYDADMGLFR
jgi:radical SAM-linked protein